LSIICSGVCPKTNGTRSPGGLFTDPGVLDELESVEADLIDDYVRGRLPQPDAELVSTRLLAGKRGAAHECLAAALANQRPARRASRAWLWIGSPPQRYCRALRNYPDQHECFPDDAILPGRPGDRNCRTRSLRTRGSAHVQQVRLQAPGMFAFRSAPTPPCGRLADSGSLSRRPRLSFSYDSFVIGTADLMAGRYQVEISSHSTLVRAGEFDVVFE